MGAGRFMSGHLPFLLRLVEGFQAPTPDLAGRGEVLLLDVAEARLISSGTLASATAAA